MAPDLTATASGGPLLYQRDVRVWPRTLCGPQAAKDSRIGNRSAAGVKGEPIAHHEHIVWGVPLLGEQDPDEPLREHRSSGDHSFTITFDAYYEAVSQTVARRDRLDTVIEDLAANSSFTPMVNRFGCLRGVSALTGLAMSVEIGDWHRFTGKTIGSFVGLVPSEYSSGQSRSQGGITKTGNSHVRRLLVEAAWHTAVTTARPANLSCMPGGRKRQHLPVSAARTGTSACTGSGSRSPPAGSVPPWQTPPSSVDLPAGAGHWPSWTTNPRPLIITDVCRRTRGVTRYTPMSRDSLGQRDARFLDPRHLSRPNTSPCGNQPAHISLIREHRQRHVRHHRPR